MLAIYVILTGVETGLGGCLVVQARVAWWLKRRLGSGSRSCNWHLILKRVEESIEPMRSFIFEGGNVAVVLVSLGVVISNPCIISSNSFILYIYRQVRHRWWKISFSLVSSRSRWVLNIVYRWPLLIMELIFIVFLGPNYIGRCGYSPTVDPDTSGAVGVSVGRATILNIMDVIISAQWLGCSSYLKDRSANHCFDHPGTLFECRETCRGECSSGGGSWFRYGVEDWDLVYAT